MDNEEIRKNLFELADEKYQKFSKNLTPTEKNIIGVRVPLIKSLAKKIAKNNYIEYLNNPFTEYHEECLLYGLVIGYIDENILIVLKYFEQWMLIVKNWAVCDSSVANMKKFKEELNQEIVWNFIIQKLQYSNEPYILRIIIVTMFCHFNNERFRSQIIRIFEKIQSEHYYVKMALAWGIAEVAVKDYSLVLKLLQKQSLNSWIQNKAIQKSCESFRLSDEQKQELRLLKIVKTLQ